MSRSMIKSIHCRLDIESVSNPRPTESASQRFVGTFRRPHLGRRRKQLIDVGHTCVRRADIASAAPITPGNLQ